MTWLFALLQKMTPDLVAGFKSGLKELLDKLAEKAKETPNEWDDWAIKVIRNTLKVDD